MLVSNARLLAYACGYLQIVIVLTAVSLALL